MAVPSIPRLKAVSMCVLLVVATVSGSVLGGAVNCINGAVSPRFFRSHELVCVDMDED